MHQRLYSQKDTSSIILTGEPWHVFCEGLGEI